MLAIVSAHIESVYFCHFLLIYINLITKRKRLRDFSFKMFGFYLYLL